MEPNLCIRTKWLKLYAVHGQLKWFLNYFSYTKYIHCCLGSIELKLRKIDDIHDKNIFAVKKARLRTASSCNHNCN